MLIDILRLPAATPHLSKLGQPLALLCTMSPSSLSPPTGLISPARVTTLLVSVLVALCSGTNYVRTRSNVSSTEGTDRHLAPTRFTPVRMHPVSIQNTSMTDPIFSLWPPIRCSTRTVPYATKPRWASREWYVYLFRFPPSPSHPADSPIEFLLFFSIIISRDLRHRSFSWQTCRCARPEVIPRHRLLYPVHWVSGHQDDLRCWTQRRSRTSISRYHHYIGHLRLLNRERGRWRWGRRT